MDVSELLNEINWLAVLVATAAAFFFGFLWYTPLFGKVWQKEQGLSEADMNAAGSNMPMKFVLNFILEFIGILVLALILANSDFINLMMGLKIGVLCGLGFSATMTGMGYIYTNKSLKLFLIDAGHQVLLFGIAGIILAIW